MGCCNSSDIIKNINGELFRQQRLTIFALAATLGDGDEATEAALEGLSNLLDSIADVAHDDFGIDCLLEGDEDEN